MSGRTNQEDTSGAISRSASEGGLEVSRADLSRALKTVARGLGKRSGDVSLGFENGYLSIGTADSIAEIPAQGIWPSSIFVDASWVRKMVRKMPAGDPVRLRVAEGRFYMNRYSESYALAPREYSPDQGLPPVNEQLRIQKAAGILKPLLISRQDLETLATEARARGPALWRPDEQKLIVRIARAWELLAPLGVDPADLKALMGDRLRNAWRGSK